MTPKVKTFMLHGAVPKDIEKDLTEAVESVPPSIFFDENNKPIKDEVNKFDEIIADSLKSLGWSPERNINLFDDSWFSIDLGSERKKTLIEIEKGILPRIELDIIKIANACHKAPEKWRFGALVVPASHIKLKLAGKRTPFVYLKNSLAKLAGPIFERADVEGFIVVGYHDPR